MTPAAPFDNHVAVKTLHATVVQEIHGDYETDPIPQAILDHAKRCEGKLITKRDATALMAAYPGLRVHIDRNAARVYVEWCAERMRYDADRRETLPDQNGLALIAMGVPDTWARRARLLVCSGEVTAHWAAPALIEAWETNAWAFKARRERNAERDHAIAFMEEGGASRTTVNQIAQHLDALTLLAQELNALMANVPERVAKVINSEFIVHTRESLNYPF